MGTFSKNLLRAKNDRDGREGNAAREIPTHPPTVGMPCGATVLKVTGGPKALVQQQVLPIFISISGRLIPRYYHATLMCWLYAMQYTYPCSALRSGL